MSGTKSGVRWISLLADGSRRLAITTSLHRLHHPEIGVVTTWPEDAARDVLVDTILRRIARYVRRTGRALRPGQTMSMTWLPFRFASPDDSEPRIPADCLLIEEAANHDGMADDGFVSGIRRTVSILLAQQDVLDRLGLAAQADHPSSQEAATICKRLVDEPASHPSIQGERFERGKGSCGWMLACCDADHDHDDHTNFLVMHLGHLIATHPTLLQYLPLPEGSAVHLHAEWHGVFRPSEEEAQMEPADALTWCP